MNEQELLLKELREAVAAMASLTQAISHLANSNEIMCELVAEHIDMSANDSGELPETGMGSKRGSIR